MNENRRRTQPEDANQQDILKQVEKLLNSTGQENAYRLFELTEKAEQQANAVFYRVHQLYAKLYEENKQFGTNPQTTTTTTEQTKEALSILRDFRAYKEMSQLPLSDEKREQKLIEIIESCDTFLRTHTV